MPDRLNSITHMDSGYIAVITLFITLYCVSITNIIIISTGIRLSVIIVIAIVNVQLLNLSSFYMISAFVTLVAG
jgi:hypothetical protein